MYSSCKRSIRRNTTWSVMYKAGHIPIRHCLTSLKLEQRSTKILKQHSNRHKRVELRVTSIKNFTNFGHHFPRATSAKILAACMRVCRMRLRSLFWKQKICPICTRDGVRLRSPSLNMAPRAIKGKKKGTLHKKILSWTYNRGQKSSGHLCNLTNYLCFTTEVGKKRCFPFENALLFPLPTQYNVENRKKLKVVVFNIVCGVGGEVRQVKL